MQQFGLELLILADGWKAGEEREEEFEDRLKLALVAAGRDPVDLWPVDAEDVDPSRDDEVNFDYSAVDWQEASPDDWAQLQRALDTTRVDVSGARAPESEDEPPVPDMGEEFDREWQ